MSFLLGGWTPDPEVVEINPAQRRRQAAGSIDRRKTRGELRNASLDRITRAELLKDLLEHDEASLKT